MSDTTTTNITPDMIKALTMVGRPAVLDTPYGPRPCTVDRVEGYDWTVRFRGGVAQLVAGQDPLAIFRHTPAAEITYTRSQCQDDVTMDRLTRGVTLVKVTDKV